MKELPAERQRRRTTVRQLDTQADGAESYETESQGRVDTIDGTGEQHAGSSYDGSGGEYVGAMFMG